MDTLKLNGWLKNSSSTIPKLSYTHRLLIENIEERAKILAELHEIVQEAHKDAKRHLRKLAGISLDPFDLWDDIPQENFSPQRDPTQGYPEKLELQTLKGYFGEIFAGIVAEIFSHFNLQGWKVPAYPFRFHNSAFDQLERWRQTGKKPGTTPGRTGDDMLAFFRDSCGQITHSLVCEAKCSNSHSANLIAEAHKQASTSNMRPVDILRLIEILSDYQDPESQSWKQALQILYSRDIQADYERCDLVSYICGQFPKKESTWIPPEKPHQYYSAGRKLEAVEIHLTNVEELVKEVYDVDPD